MSVPEVSVIQIEQRYYSLIGMKRLQTFILIEFSFETNAARYISTIH